MNKYLNNYRHERGDVRNLYNTPQNRRLKYVALGFITIAIILLLCIAFWIEDLPIKTILIMRGCAGVFATVFAVLVGLLVYRVNKEYTNNRYKYKKH